MVKKEFTYRGKTVAELKTMGIREFMELLPARQRRCLKRGFTEAQEKFLAKIKKFNEGRTKKPVKTHCRDIVVLPEMIGMTIHIYRGNKFEPVLITEDMVGRYLGEFTYNRTKVQHSAPGIGATKSSAAISVK